MFKSFCFGSKIFFTLLADPAYKISSKSDYISLKYGDLTILKMRWSAILDFQILKIKFFVVTFRFLHFYRAMHFSAKRGIAIACRLSVRLSVCNVGELWSHRLEFFENNFIIS